MRFESMGKCTSYLLGTVSIALPEEKPYCNYCIVGCRYEEGNRRHTCRFTGKVILDPFHSRPADCPAQWSDLQEEEG